MSEPLHAIYQELVKGRVDVTDRKARMDAIESLKRMIRAWLDENYPKMHPNDRAARAEAMDISLIEQHMEGKVVIRTPIYSSVLSVNYLTYNARVNQVHLRSTCTCTNEFDRNAVHQKGQFDITISMLCSLHNSSTYICTLKELLSALVAMDELMGSNEMNMQVSAHH